MWSEKKGYRPVSAAGSDDGSDSTEADSPMLSQSNVRALKRQCSLQTVVLASGVNLLLWVLSMGALVVYLNRPEPLNAALKAVSSPSRILDELKVNTITKQVNGSFFLPASSQTSLGRAEPGPETNDLYDHFETIRYIPLTKQQLVDSHVDPKYAVKLDNDYWGLGEDAYLGQVDNYHKIHCFNELRKGAFETYLGNAPKPRTEIQWVHLRHCADILLQDLMCHADTDFITFQWTETQFNPFPNFNIHRQCRDFEAIDDWTTENALNMTKYILWPRPKDANVVPIEPGYWPLFMGMEGRPADYTDDWAEDESRERHAQSWAEWSAHISKKGDPYSRGWQPPPLASLDQSPKYHAAHAKHDGSAHEGSEHGSPPQADDHHSHGH